MNDNTLQETATLQINQLIDTIRVWIVDNQQNLELTNNNNNNFNKKNELNILNRMNGLINDLNGQITEVSLFVCMSVCVCLYVCLCDVCLSVLSIYLYIFS